MSEEKFPSFNEYMSSTGKTLEKAPVEKVADYKGPKPNSPQKSGAWPESADSKGKKKPAGSPSPYSGPGTDPGLAKAEKGFGDEGDKKLIYTPGTEAVTDKEGGSKKSSWPKTQTEQFIDATKDMSTQEFTTFMAERTTRGGIEFEAVKYVASNPIALKDLIREAKRAGSLGIVAEAMLSVPDAHSALVKALAENELLKANFVEALEVKMLEAVGPPLHKDKEDEDDGMGDVHGDDDTMGNGPEDDHDLDHEHDDEDEDDDDDLDMDGEDEDDGDLDLDGPEPSPDETLDGGEGGPPIDDETMTKLKKFMKGL